MFLWRFFCLCLSCSLDSFLQGNSCTLCDSTCGSCSGAGISECFGCPSGRYLQETTCFLCHSSCSTCSGATQNHCTSCKLDEFLKSGSCISCAVEDSNDCSGETKISYPSTIVELTPEHHNHLHSIPQSIATFHFPTDCRPLTREAFELPLQIDSRRKCQRPHNLEQDFGSRFSILKAHYLVPTEIEE